MRHKISPWFLQLIFATALSYSSRAGDPFAENIRTTEPLSPAEEQKTFHLPPGFEIHLFASEPDIVKPINMAFDAKGRLWITDSREYPNPVPLGKPSRDTIKILEDTDGDGKADKITTFVDGLNIPTGLYPYQEGVIAWSIPNIWHFQDVDGDGKAEKREPLYGPLGWERDTHGMNSSFRRGFDGWLYATHGYNNNTTLRGRDGSEIRMNSGNTYRVRLDGSRVEQHTWGQVNPFGLCFDPLGNMYSADCHSAPIYQLLRGGYYPSFGKPDDGLGFAPTLMEHAHGSTAICGIIYYADDQWPEEFQDNIIIGNVMTSRLNRDHLIKHGSSPVAIEQPDFLTTTDPWFRPVDNQFGPDGALYVADFYNRIIGHYEVPLNHPGRDRFRGRIWRITYTGSNGMAPLRKPETLKIADASTAQLITRLGHPNPTLRMLALNELVDRVGSSAVAPLLKLFSTAVASPLQKMYGIWALQRLGGLNEAALRSAAGDPDMGVRTHSMHVLAEITDWTPAHRELALAGLRDSDPSVKRAAADALGQHPAFEHIAPLLLTRDQVPSEDNHFLYVVRMALRNQLKVPENFTRLQTIPLSEKSARYIADVAVAIPTSEAGSFLLAHIQKYPENTPELKKYLRHASRYIPESKIGDLARFTRERFAEDVDLQLTLFKSVQEGTAQRGITVPLNLKEWGSELADRLLVSVDSSALSWRALPVPGMAPTSNPWFLQQRKSSDGNDASPFLCSLPPGGEKLTGILRSQTFVIPEKLSFFVAGHDGFPNESRKGRNLVRLCSLTGAVIKSVPAPRNDLAQPVEWDLSSQKGKMGYLELVDADDGPSYAWIAAGRFSPSVVPLPSIDPSQITKRQQYAADLAQTLVLTNLEPKLLALVSSPATDLPTRAATAKALLAIKPDETLLALIPMLGDPTISEPLRQNINEALVARDSKRTSAALTEALKMTPHRVQLKIAQALAGTAPGAENLLAAVERGEASPSLLAEPSIKDKLLAAKPANGDERFKKLTASLTPPNEAIQKLIDQRRVAYVPAKANPENGLRVFTQTCSVCHQIDGHGNVVGPQLDGIGNRGLERLLEDVLDPNRNVDRSFRTHILVLKDGDVVSGLPRREEGELLILADSTGKEISVPKKNIQQRRESENSLMPENFGEIIPPADFNDLMAFLLSKGSKAPAP